MQGACARWFESSVEAEAAGGGSGAGDMEATALGSSRTSCQGGGACWGGAARSAAAEASSLSYSGHDWWKSKLLGDNSDLMSDVICQYKGRADVLYEWSINF